MNIERFIELLNESGLSQAELAKQINVSRSAITQYSNGSSEPKPSTLIKIADVLDTSVDYLLGKSNLKNDLNKVYENLDEKGRERVEKYISDMQKLYSIDKSVK